MVASALLKNTGTLKVLLEFLSPFFMKLHIPKNLCELVMLRPVSGGGSIALLTDIYKNTGADSIDSLIASVIAASTETTLYTISVYFGATRVKKTLPVITAGLMADAFTVFFSIFIINVFFK